MFEWSCESDLTPCHVQRDEAPKLLLTGVVVHGLAGAAPLGARARTVLLLGRMDFLASLLIRSARVALFALPGLSALIALLPGTAPCVLTIVLSLVRRLSVLLLPGLALFLLLAALLVLLALLVRWHGVLLCVRVWRWLLCG